MSYPYHHIVLGGTFDLLHVGHQAIISKAFKLGKFVTIGLTTDKFNQLRNKPSFQNQALRFKSVKGFLKKTGFIERSNILYINDVFGTTLKDPTLQAIVVTSETKSTTYLINKKRSLKGLKKLEIITQPLLKDQKGKIISSTRIRAGEINTLGQSYKNILLKIAGKKLSDQVRNKLKRPLGEIIDINSLSQASSIITVGDVTSQNTLKANFKPILSIVDTKVGRKEILTNLNHSVKVKNPPSQISKSLILEIDKILKKLPLTYYSLSTILVDGEEDLATIPAILLAPLEFAVLYGQPNQGLVEVKVDLKIKNYLCKLLL